MKPKNKTKPYTLTLTEGQLSYVVLILEEQINESINYGACDTTTTLEELQDLYKQVTGTKWEG